MTVQCDSTVSQYSGDLTDKEHVPSLTVPLTPREVHQVELCLPDVLVTEGVAVDDLEVDGEDGV